jgi:hypothetical protein
MPRAPAKIRKRYIEGATEVLDWEIEETLVYGVAMVFGPPSLFKTADQWRREWHRWRDVILPKSLKHRPGVRPFAMYATGEIPARELAMPLPQPNGWWTVDVRNDDGTVTTHYINVPEPFMVPEVVHLRRLGIVDAAELRRHREWMNATTPECDRWAVDTYPLEMSLYE